MKNIKKLPKKIESLFLKSKQMEGIHFEVDTWVTDRVEYQYVVTLKPGWQTGTGMHTIWAPDEKFLLEEIDHLKPCDCNDCKSRLPIQSLEEATK